MGTVEPLLFHDKEFSFRPKELFLAKKAVARNKYVAVVVK